MTSAFCRRARASLRREISKTTMSPGEGAASQDDRVDRDGNTRRPDLHLRDHRLHPDLRREAGGARRVPSHAPQTGDNRTSVLPGRGSRRSRCGATRRRRGLSDRRHPARDRGRFAATPRAGFHHERASRRAIPRRAGFRVEQSIAHLSGGLATIGSIDGKAP